MFESEKIARKREEFAAAKQEESRIWGELKTFLEKGEMNADLFQNYAARYDAALHQTYCRFNELMALYDEYCTELQEKALALAAQSL
ncbi:MAG: hypothetical protein KGJ13_01485 [Patescibacteria group bacterium]|nr:hypothetical protein [Patescibacteria group bacterium]